MKVLSSIILTFPMMITYCRGASISDIENDVNNINGNITAFNDGLSSFTTSPGIMTLFTLASNAQTAITAISQGVSDAQTLAPISVLEAPALATVITNFATNCAGTLAAIADAQPTFSSLPMIGGLAGPAISGILLFLQSLALSFENGILAAVPAAAQAPFLAAQTTVNTALTAAIATF